MSLLQIQIFTPQYLTILNLKTHYYTNHKMPPTPSPITLPKATKFGALRPRSSFFSRLGGFWFVINMIFIISILGTAIYLSVQAHDISPGIEYLGNKTLTITANLDEQCLEIIENKGLYEKGEGFIDNAWNFMKSIWGFLVSLFIIYLWLKILTWIFMMLIIMDDSKTTNSFLLAILFFFLIQILFVVMFTDKPAMTPLTSFSHLVQALPYIFSPVVNLVEKVKS